MADTGEMLVFKNRVCFDKHSIGGVPGDKTSIIVVPIIAAAGLTIPKTSSRAITSPAGTADRFECIAPVELKIDEVKKVVEKTNGCIVWGGSVNLAPADDIFIQIEYPLSIDPFLLPSVMSKKKAVNAKYVVIDIPTGRETKIKTEEGFESLAADFVELGRRLGIKVEAVSTFGEQPVGYGIGPMLEAREALEAVKTGVGHKDLIDKATTLAGVLLEFGGHRNGKKMALDILRSGKAYKKLRGIIEAQGGDPDIKPRSLCETVKIAEIKSNNNGKVLWISNREIAQIAREAGAPKDKVAGVVLCKKIGDKVKRGDTLFEIHSKKTYKFNNALDITKRTEVMKIGKELRMELEEFPHKEEEKRYFILER
jgi:AMP phosphorylase